MHVIELRDDSRLDALVRRTRFLMFADDDGDGGVNYHLTTEDELICPPRDDEALADHFSVTEQTVHAETWLTATDATSPG